MQCIEIVPNISEGKNQEIIRYIIRQALHNNAAKLLHCDSNADANRTVLTIAGEAHSVTQAAFQLIQAASEKIDMRFHKGEHPRLGATDVCPLVPISGISLHETAVLADQLARRVGRELHLPVYLYEQNASDEERKNLAVIRKGEYESLPQKIIQLPPDYGSKIYSEQTAKTGAVIIGARNFLIAFNISLNTQDTFPAKQIAAILREKNNGLKAVKAIGWYMEGYKSAQVSFNLTDFHTTGLAEVFEACQKEAEKAGLRIIGSELIGLAPMEAILNAGRFYNPSEKDPDKLIELAVKKLGLNKICPFNPKERILENLL